MAQASHNISYRRRSNVLECPCLDCSASEAHAQNISKNCVIPEIASSFDWPSGAFANEASVQFTQNGSSNG
ncbi:hypothetical protein JTB14_029189 [Gonioctena quinquepunctata]|nr:hypothetical protein JTB14_029189 [Gonioctena quinquepunctata]